MPCSCSESYAPPATHPSAAYVYPRDYLFKLSFQRHAPTRYLQYPLNPGRTRDTTPAAPDKPKTALQEKNKILFHMS